MFHSFDPIFIWIYDYYDIIYLDLKQKYIERDFSGYFNSDMSSKYFKFKI